MVESFLVDDQILYLYRIQESNPDSRMLFRARRISSASKASTVPLTSASALNIRKEVKENDAVEVMFTSNSLDKKKLKLEAL